MIRVVTHPPRCLHSVVCSSLNVHCLWVFPALSFSPECWGVWSWSWGWHRQPHPVPASSAPSKGFENPSQSMQTSTHTCLVLLEVLPGPISSPGRGTCLARGTAGNPPAALSRSGGEKLLPDPKICWKRLLPDPKTCWKRLLPDPKTCWKCRSPSQPFLAAVRMRKVRASQSSVLQRDFLAAAVPSAAVLCPGCA